MLDNILSKSLSLWWRLWYNYWQAWWWCTCDLWWWVMIQKPEVLVYHPHQSSSRGWGTPWPTRRSSPCRWWSSSWWRCWASHRIWSVFSDRGHWTNWAAISIYWALCESLSLLVHCVGGGRLIIYCLVFIYDTYMYFVGSCSENIQNEIIVFKHTVNHV